MCSDQNSFDIIVCDPPWFFNSRKTGGVRHQKTKFGGGCQKHYDLMKDSDLLNLKPHIDSISSKNCAMFMWTVMPKLDFGIKLLEEWGFKYRTTAFCWVKTYSKSGDIVKNPGYYTSSNIELVILGTKNKDGKYFEPKQKMISQIVKAPRLAHSQKPEEVQDKIDLMYPNYKKIELFARRRRNGWTTVGNELSGLDIREELENIIKE